MASRRFDRLFGGPPRMPETPLTQREMDIARSIQEITEECMLRMAAFAHRKTGLRDLCLAGGVALNCVGNGRLLREGPFEEIWIQPAAGDAGGAVGIAFNLWHRYLEKPRLSAEGAGTWARSSAEKTPVAGLGGERPYADGIKGAFLGPAFSDEEIAGWLTEHGYAAERFERSALATHIAQLLVEGRVIGLFQGRMEFGPRALGGRSIIGDARSPEMQTVMNVKIKFRESFRPFAPSVLREHVRDWFDLEDESPYMLLVAAVCESQRRAPTEADHALRGLDKLKGLRSEIPAVTHVDYSARIQTVRRDVNPLYYDIIHAFFERTGCPVIVNTSFNVRGEPIVCTPEEAYRCFQRTNMDVLVLESFVLTKDPHTRTEQVADWLHEFALD